MVSSLVANSAHVLAQTGGLIVKTTPGIKGSIRVLLTQTTRLNRLLHHLCT